MKRPLRYTLLLAALLLLLGACVPYAQHVPVGSLESHREVFPRAASDAPTTPPRIPLNDLPPNGRFEPTPTLSTGPAYAPPELVRRDGMIQPICYDPATGTVFHCAP